MVLEPRKTIALYDTLIEKHTENELVAVLAHEVGHLKKACFSGLIMSIIRKIGRSCTFSLNYVSNSLKFQLLLVWFRV